MPPERQSPQKNNDPPAGRKPEIRTMKSDVDEFLKTSKPSLASMIGNTGARISSAEEQRPSRLPIILVFTVLGIAVIGGGAFFLIRTLSGGIGSSGTGPATAQKLVPPPPFFATETSRTINVTVNDRPGFARLMADSMAEKERDGTIKRILVDLKDGPQERFATFVDFLDLWRITPPQSLADQISSPLMVFIYYGKNGSRLGIAARTRAPDRTLSDMLSWEPGLLRTFTPFFFDEKVNSVIAPFEDRTYRNIDWRYLKLSQDKDLGIAHAVFPAGNILIITMSKEAMETTINRLFDAR